MSESTLTMPKRKTRLTSLQREVLQRIRTLTSDGYPCAFVSISRLCPGSSHNPIGRDRADQLLLQLTASGLIEVLRSPLMDEEFVLTTEGQAALRQRP